MWAARSAPPEESAPPPGQSLVLPLVQDAATLTQRPTAPRADPCALQREVHLPDLQDGDQPQGPPVAPHAAGAWRGPADGGIPAAAYLPLLPQGAAQHGRPRRACRQLPPLRQRERLRCGVGREDRGVPDLFGLLFAGRLRRRMKLWLVLRRRLKCKHGRHHLDARGPRVTSLSVDLRRGPSGKCAEARRESLQNGRRVCLGVTPG